jgi:hypothetical protein
MTSAPTAVRPAFVTIAIRPSCLGRVEVMHTTNPKFGKVEYFWPRALTHRSGVLPDGQRKMWGSLPAVIPARARTPSSHHAQTMDFRFDAAHRGEMTERGDLPDGLRHWYGSCKPSRLPSLPEEDLNPC